MSELRRRTIHTNKSRDRVSRFLGNDGPTPTFIASGSLRPDGVEHQFLCGNSVVDMGLNVQVLIRRVSTLITSNFSHVPLFSSYHM